MRAAVRRVWTGAAGVSDFVDSGGSAVRRAYTRAAIAGARENGVRLAEFSPEETAELETLINEQFQYLLNFGQDVNERNRAEGFLIRPHLRRVEYWIGRYDRIVDRFKIITGRNLKYMWVIGQAEHCRSCLALAGQVRRGQFWRDNVEPKDTRLECNGFECKCRLVRTDRPLSRGRLPRWQ